MTNDLRPLITEQHRKQMGEEIKYAKHHIWGVASLQFFHQKLRLRLRSNEPLCAGLSNCSPGSALDKGLQTDLSHHKWPDCTIGPRCWSPSSPSGLCGGVLAFPPRSPDPDSNYSFFFLSQLKCHSPMETIPLLHDHTPLSP